MTKACLFLWVGGLWACSFSSVAKKPEEALPSTAQEAPASLQAVPVSLPASVPASRGASAPIVYAPLVLEEKVNCQETDRPSLSIPKTSSSLRCKDGFRKCEGEIPVTIENCTGQDLVINWLMLRRLSVVAEHVALGWEESLPWPTLAHGVKMTRLIKVSYGGVYKAELSISSSKWMYMTSSAEGELENPAYLSARADCKACNGSWGTYGLSRMEGCLCRAKDAGEACYNGDECEGACLFVKVEKLGNGLGRNLGKCSEFIGGLGCYQYIPKGASDGSPKPLSELGSVHTVCVD